MKAMEEAYAMLKLQWTAKVRAQHPDVPFGFHSRKPTLEDVILVLKAGAVDAIRKGTLKSQELLIRVAHALEIRLKTFARILVVMLCVSGIGTLGGVSFAQKRPAQAGPAPALDTRMGMWRGRPVTYQVIDGRNIYQGDIILENVQPLATAGAVGVIPQSVGLSYSTYLWPKVGSVYQIPYVIDPASGAVDNISTAIGIYNATFAGAIQMVPHTAEANYIDILLEVGNETGVCEATEGDAGIGEQIVTGSEACTVATILHEFGHVTGVWHEQSRTDAASFVTFNYNNVIKGSLSYFTPVADDAQNLTLYDYASVMEYPAFSFTRNGGPPLDSIPPGMPLSNLFGYSAADIEGIMRLYGAAPTEVTVTSNPPGLHVIVDGKTVTTPQLFNWALNSAHTLDVAIDVQTVSGDIVNSDPPVPTTFYYTFGRWNDDGTQSHTITVTPGNGDVAFPVSAPQVSTYTANFIQLSPYTSSVFPSGSGSVTVSPTPQSYPGVSGVYLVARQQAKLTATANSGFNFYEFNNAKFWLPGGLGANPKTFYVPDTGLAVNTTAEFSNTPVYTVDVSPDAFSSNLTVDIDDQRWDVPKNFSSYYDSSWTANSTHTLEFPTPQQPFSSNTEFVFSSWNVGGATNAPNSVTLPATSTSYIATITPEFMPASNFDFPPCGGSATIMPVSTEGFYPSGTELTYTATPDPGWTFAGWTFDLLGTTNPAELTPTDESLVYANFNTTNVPLTLTSISPSTVTSGGSQFTLTLTGTGFTSGSLVGINFPNTFLTPTFVSSTELQMTVPASAIANPTTFQVFVENFPSGWSGCAVFGYQPFFVSQGPPSGATIVTATPATVTFSSTAVDATNTGQTITVKNTGAANTAISIVASENFGQTNTCGTALSAGATCTITPTFTPTATGPLTGNIAVTDSATNSPQIVSLTGTGLVPVTFSPTTLAFGSVAVGSTSAPKTITMTNNQSTTLTFTFSASGNYSVVGSGSPACGTSLAPGAKCSMSVMFSPTSTGALAGDITISDSATNSPQIVSLTGTGLVPVTFSPTTLAFGSVAVGSTSAPKTITMTNNQSTTLTFTFSASGNYSVVGSGSPACGTSLAPGAKCSMSVTFTPTSGTVIDGVLTVADSAAFGPQEVQLTGTGTGGTTAPLQFTPTSLTFASQVIGTTSTAKTVTVKNVSTGSVTFTSIVASGNFTAGSGTTPCTGMLASNASCEISVTFSPTVSGSNPGAIAVTDNASVNQQVVNLTGTAIAPVTFSPASLTFASQGVSTTSAPQTVTLKNNTSESLALEIVASGDFGIAAGGTCSSPVGAHSTCTIIVTFTPSTTGSIKGVVTVSDTATGSPQILALTGTGGQL